MARTFCLTLAVVLLLGCPRGSNQPDQTGTGPGNPPANPQLDRAATQVRTGIREVTDVLVQQAAAANAVAKDATVTEFIREYEALGPDERVRFIIDNKGKMDTVRDLVSDDDDDDHYQKAMAHIDAVLAKMGGMPVTIPPAEFDLAMAKRQAYAQQVQLTNQLFNDMEPEALTAMQAFDKMAPEQRRAFAATPNASASILYWQYMYLARKVALLRHFHNYTYQTEWGYKTPVPVQTRAVLDQQFDLKRPAH